MTDSKIKTRFAPSPTGYLHVGGARTALYNWLYARNLGGKFILRIEDTDTARSTEKSVEAILEGMSWLGMDWDEGPYYQSKRAETHRNHALKLLSEGKAYRCFCKASELENRREKAIKNGKSLKYDGRCRTVGKRGGSGSYAIRFMVPAGITAVNDLIKGCVRFDNSEIEDFIILRSDGTPTYNLSVVADDANMQITHIIRGDDHLNNTPKQIMLYLALGFDMPYFAHLPMILGPDGTRLSKRHGATSVVAYREMGYLPNALANYLVRLGWSHGDQEIFTREELVEFFSLDNIGKSSGIFNPEKLLWLNAHYIREASVEELVIKIRPYLEAEGCNIQNNGRVPLIISTLRERARTLQEMSLKSSFYFLSRVEYDEKAARKFLTPGISDILIKLNEKLAAITDFDVPSIQTIFQSLIDESGLKLGKIAQPVRVALTGGTASPGIFETIEAMGREMTIKRLTDAIRFIEEKK